MQTFPVEDYVYLFIEVLARRVQHDAFVKSVIAILLTFPLVKEYKVRQSLAPRNGKHCIIP